ncbi:MAG: hypothetical protein NVS1B11_23000 [Terriglobales bacterium]
MRQLLPEFLLLLTVAMLAGCGSPGIPLPPSLNLPKPVSDLRAVRKGNTITLAWTVPTATTDHQKLRRAGPTQICRSLETFSSDCQSPIGEVPTSLANNKKTQQKSAPAAAKVQDSYKDTIPESLQSENSTAQIVYAVSVLNDRGRSAGLSNQVRVPAAPTLPAPENFKAEVRSDGILLAWTKPSRRLEVPGLSFKYRVYRREDGSASEDIAGELPLDTDEPTQLVDKNVQWEKKYLYRATIVTIVKTAERPEVEIEGDDSDAIEVTAHDIFPPAVPSGLEAVFTQADQKSFVDLIWTPDTNLDLAGYNIYRREDSGQPAKINSELVKVPAYRDFEIRSGKKYFYSVSAVDSRSNESAHSSEASENVP